MVKRRLTDNRQHVDGSTDSQVNGLSDRYGVYSYSSQFVLKSFSTHFGQFVRILVNSYSFWSICTHLIKFSQLVLSLVNSYSYQIYNFYNFIVSNSSDQTFL